MNAQAPDRSLWGINSPSYSVSEKRKEEAARIVEHISDHRWRTCMEIGDRLSLSNVTVARILKGLWRMGYVERDLLDTRPVYRLKEGQADG